MEALFPELGLHLLSLCDVGDGDVMSHESVFLIIRGVAVVEATPDAIFALDPDFVFLRKRAVLDSHHSVTQRRLLRGKEIGHRHLGRFFAGIAQHMAGPVIEINQSVVFYNDDAIVNIVRHAVETSFTLA